MRNSIHVTPHPDGGWQIKLAGNERATARTDIKAEAVEKARELAKKNNAELVIHGKDGKIQDSDSYGNDPFPPRDKVH